MDGKDISCKLKQKESWGSKTHSRQNRLKNKNCKKKRQKRALLIIKVPIQEENVIIINIYAPNTGASNYVKQILVTIKAEINSNTIIPLISYIPQWIDHLGRKLKRKQWP